MNGALRREVLERDSHRCRGCGLSKGPLEVHHIIYRSQGGKDEAWNLITLCRGCHGRAHGTNGPRVVPWRWFAILRANVWGVEKAETLELCATCDHRTALGWCQEWDQEVVPEMTCGRWTLRDFGVPL